MEPSLNRFRAKAMFWLNSWKRVNLQRSSAVHVAMSRPMTLSRIIPLTVLYPPIPSLS